MNAEQFRTLEKNLRQLCQKAWGNQNPCLARLCQGPSDFMETLSEILQKNGVSLEAISERWKNKYPNHIAAGYSLTIEEGHLNMEGCDLDLEMLLDLIAEVSS